MYRYCAQCGNTIHSLPSSHLNHKLTTHESDRPNTSRTNEKRERQDAYHDLLRSSPEVLQAHEMSICLTSPPSTRSWDGGDQGRSLALAGSQPVLGRSWCWSWPGSFSSTRGSIDKAPVQV